MAITNDLLTVAEKRGQRVKQLRAMANLTRQRLYEKYGISVETVKGWEIARHGGLTKKGASRLIELFAKEGIICQIDWLLDGSGNPPIIKQKLANLNNSHYSSVQRKLAKRKSDEMVLRELLFFKGLHTEILDFLVKDDSMSPVFISGDIVAGRVYHNGQIKKCVGKDCIVRLENGEILLRRITRYDANLNTYTLAIINPNSAVAKPILDNTALDKAAPIIWRRLRG